jgi:hypothetical protein
MISSLDSSTGSKQRDLSRAPYWLIFGATQTVGLILLHVADVHLGQITLFMGLAFLFPGDLLGFILFEGTSPWIAVPPMVLANAIVWDIFLKIYKLRETN